MGHLEDDMIGRPLRTSDSKKNGPKKPTGPHPDAELIVRYVLGGLGIVAKKKLELHLTDCPDCTVEVATLRQVLSEQFDESGKKKAK